LKDWIVESHDVAKDFIYAQIEFNSSPTDDYMKKSYEIVKRRITLGGYRLSEIIKTIKHSHDNFLKNGKNELNKKKSKFLSIEK